MIASWGALFYNSRMKCTRTRFRPETMVLCSLLLLGAAARLFGCWALRHNMNLDAGVVALMTKHIAEGKAFPVFFYGQPHMGSLEALFGGLFSRLFGLSGFTVCLGTAFVAFWILPIVYLWARDSAGRTAGWAATAFCIMGPSGFFHYNVSPRGGYAAVLTFGALLLWWSTRMATRWIRDRRQSGLDFFLLGIGAGLAWWNSQLTTAAILTAALLLLIVLRRQVFTWRLGPGVLGFFTGSAPFWVYNIRHDWASFEFAGTFGRVKLSDGLTWFFTDRFTSLMVPHIGPDWLPPLVVWLYVLFALYGCWLLYRAYRIKEWPLALSLSGILLFTLIFSLLYSSSHFAAIRTPRYFLPMVAPLAVLMGIATAQWTRRLPRPVAWMPILFLIGMQWPVLPWALSTEKRQHTQLKFVHTLEEFLEGEELDIVFASNRRRAWNFALRERIAFVDLQGDFYRPNAQRAEWAERIAVLENYGALREFARTAGISHRTHRVGRIDVDYDFEALPVGWKAIPPDQIRSIEDPNGRDVRDALMDHNMHTRWHAQHADREEYVIVNFAMPVEISGLRMLATDRNGYPYHWSVEGKTPEGEWKTLREPAGFTRYFWSGSRPYWAGPYFRLEARFPPVRLTRLRIRNQPKRGDWVWSIHTLQVFGPDDPAVLEETELSTLIDLLNRRGIKRLYADRWVANRVYLEAEGAVQTTLDPHLFPDRDILHPNPMWLDDGTALLVRREDAPATRHVLASRALEWSETRVDPWILFDGWPAGSEGEAGLRWQGHAPLLNDAQWAVLQWQRARNRIDDGLRDERTAELLEWALEINPYLYQARRALIETYQAMGTHEQVRLAEQEWINHAQPDIPAYIRFANGAEFLGYRLDPPRVRPGETFRLTYYWRVPPKLPTTDFAVFVHFRRGHILFQDDHVFLLDVPPALITASPNPVIIPVKREITVPGETTEEPIHIRLGMLERRHNQRLRPNTDLPTRRHAVTLPMELEITD